MQILIDAMSGSVTEAFQKLLTQKHLYQYIEVDLTRLNDAANIIREEYEMSSSIGRPERETTLAEDIENTKYGVWAPVDVPVSSTSAITDPEWETVIVDAVKVNFVLPTINTMCHHCKEAWPFKAIHDESFFIQGGGQNECYYLSYLCQQCSATTVRFLVNRKGLRIYLAGRYPMEDLKTPKVLPDTLHEYYRDALILNNAGKTLPALFMLRVFIEQFWRARPEVKSVITTKPKATGDEMGTAYNSGLPDDFKQHFPSLLSIYDEISEALHTANANTVLFTESCAKIVEHFDARRLHKLK